jgi:hypothetical protein
MALVALASCGAGAITAGIFGSRRSGGDSTPVSLTVSPGAGPISLPSEFFLSRTATLRGVRVPENTTLELALVATVAGSVVEDEQIVGRSTSNANETVVDFALATARIAAAIGDPRVADLPAQVIARARRTDGSTIELARASFVLLRQPVLTLEPNRPDLGASLIPVSGGDLSLLIDNLPSDDPRELLVEVVTLDPNPPAGSQGPLPVLRSPAQNLLVEAIAGQPSRRRIVCTAPPATIAIPAFVQVRHSLAGLSTAIGDVYYRPELAAVVARRASTRGGDLLTLTGRALIPFDFTANPPQPAIRFAQISIEKGGRSITVPIGDLRPALSTLNSIVFVAPPSPDGRPGPATVRLVTQLSIPVITDGADLLSYGAARAELAPLGVGFDEAVVNVALASTDRTTPGVASVATLFDDAAGVPFVRVFDGLGNGVFAARGVETIAGDRADIEQRAPIDLAWVNLDGNALLDVLVLNGGTTRGAHTRLFGQSSPAVPLAFSGVGFRSASRPRRLLAGSVDADALVDLVVVGSSRADLTSVLARSSGGGGFLVQPLFTQVVDRLEVSTLTDLDDDGFDDIAMAVGGVAGRLHLAFGDANGSMADRREVDLSGFGGVSTGELIGIHAAGPRPNRSLVMVLREFGGVSHALLHLTPTSTRDYAVAPIVQPFGPNAPVASLSADLDDDDLAELIVARSDAAPVLLSFQGDRLVELVGAVEVTATDSAAVRAMHFGRATEDGNGALDAVFLLQDTSAVRSERSRVTTLLVAPGPRLLDPRASRSVPEPPRGIVLVERAVGGPGRDAILVLENGLRRLTNDGLGRFADADQFAISGLVKETVTRALGPSGIADRVVMLAADGRVGVLDSQSAGMVWSPFTLITGGASVQSQSRLRAADIDADGREDLVVVLATLRGGGEVETELLVLRGDSTTTFPYVAPRTDAYANFAAPIADVGVGDFAPTDPSSHLEVVVAVSRADPARGLHFFRFDPGSAEDDWQLIESTVDPADPRIATALDPASIVVADFDGDGFDDLFLSSASLDLAQLFRQTGISTRTTGDPTQVDPLVFAASGSFVLPAGTPRSVHLTDLDGDRVSDVLVVVARRNSPGTFTLATLVSDGLAGFSGVEELPAIDVGSFGPALSIDVGDLNGDAIADAAFAWSGDGGIIPPSLRLLFGTHR